MMQKPSNPGNKPRQPLRRITETAQQGHVGDRGHSYRLGPRRSPAQARMMRDLHVKLQKAGLEKPTSYR